MCDEKDQHLQFFMQENKINNGQPLTKRVQP